MLETKRLYLRQWVPDDWVRFQPLVTDPRVTRFIHPQTGWTEDRVRERVREYIRHGEGRGWQLWPVFRHGDSRMIGCCGFSDGFPPDVEIGWRLLPEYWGQGLATEAARETLAFGFRRWGFERVIAVAQTLNLASTRVMQKIGMTQERQFIHHGQRVVQYVAEHPRGAAATPEVQLRDATLSDVPLLTRLNQQLIGDESSENPMSQQTLQERMARWLAANWRAVIFECEQRPAGYALFQLRADDYFPSSVNVHVRHFLIDRAFRRQGIGRAAFRLLLHDRFGKAARVVLDVLAANGRGHAFWTALGFQPHTSTMRLSLSPATRMSEDTS